MPKRFHLLCLLTWTMCQVASAQTTPAEKENSPARSRHHVFIDYEIIWTLEMIKEGDRETPVLNIVTFTPGERPLRPQSIRIHNAAGKRARVRRFSLDTGAQAYVTPFFKVLGNSFIGIDLVGEFDDFSEPAKVSIDLGEYRYQLEPIDPLGFENLVEQINKINYESPDIREDFRILEIQFRGTRGLKPKR